MKRTTLSILLIGLCALALFAQPQKPTIAILDVGGTNIDTTQTMLVYEYIIDRINRSDAYTVVERAALEQAMDELEISLSDMVDASTAVQIGKVAGARLVLVSSLTLTEGVYYLSMRIVDVQTSKIMNTAIETADSFREIDTLTSSAVARLLDLDGDAEDVFASPSKKKGDRTGLNFIVGGGVEIALLEYAENLYSVPGIDGLLYGGYDIEAGPGLLGIGLLFGIHANHSKETLQPNQQYQFFTIPVNLEVKYVMPLGPAFAAIHAAGGMGVNIAMYDDPNFDGQMEPLVGAKPMILPGLSFGFQVSDTLAIAVYGRYVLSLYDDLIYNGIMTGIYFDMKL